jgi:hypothetical protein
VIYRPLQEGSLAMVKRCGYSLEVIGHVGLRYLRDSVSLPDLHQELTEKYGVRISPRHVPNLLQVFLALVECRNADTEAVQARLRQQGALIPALDAVQFDDTSPALYVIREVLSGEVLYSARLEHRGAEDVKPLLERVKALGIPILAVVSDKEKALVTAAREVLPGVPHQLCQPHYLRNVAKPMEEPLAQLGGVVREAVAQVREVEKRLQQEPSADQEERQLVQELCTVVSTVGKSAGDPLMNPTPLKRYQRLEEVVQAAEEARGLREGAWPLLTRLLAALAVLASQRALAERLARQVGVVRQIAHILKMEASSRQVKRVLRTYLNRLVREVPHEEKYSPWASFVRHARQVSDRFWAGLFHCYDDPRIPRTNNDLERLFGIIKRQQRKVTGRKSTSGGPLETCAPFVLGALSALQHQPQIHGLLQDVPHDKLVEGRHRLKELAGPARRRRSIRRNPTRRLKELLRRWKEAGGSD